MRSGTPRSYRAQRSITTSAIMSRNGGASFTAEARTANGMIRLAPVTLDEIRIDRISVASVPALISEHDQEMALLGMNFLRQLRRFEIRNGELVLE